MQKALIFASTLNKVSYGFSGIGHNIILDDFFEQEGTEPPRKKACVVKSVPMTVGKKLPTATNVARESTSEQDPDYKPGGGGWGVR